MVDPLPVTPFNDRGSSYTGTDITDETGVKVALIPRTQLTDALIEFEHLKGLRKDNFRLIASLRNW